MKQTVDEQKQGKFKPEPQEPQWEVFLKDGKVHSNIPFKQFLPTLRFPRAQGKEGSSYSYRPIDDATGSGLNPSTGFSEQMRMQGLETLLTTAHYVRKKFAGWGPAGARDHNLVVTLVWSHDVGTTGEYRAFAHRAQPSGALRAVGSTPASAKACVTSSGDFSPYPSWRTPTTSCESDLRSGQRHRKTHSGESTSCSEPRSSSGGATWSAQSSPWGTRSQKP